jgi:membrane protease YdiL (CAAX protease family)
MLKKLKQQPLLASSLIVLLYGLWFVIPMFVKTIDPNAHGTHGIEGALSQWSSELITAIVLAVFLSLLGWWREIGFTRINKGGIKFLIPIVLLALIILNLAWVMDESGKWLFGFETPLQLFALLSVMLLLGFVEEGVFRGVFFYGLSTKLTPLFTVILSAVIFGLFHFVNLFTGADFISTIYQVIHAGAMGFLYASLRLRLGAIWPLMIMHAFWDFTLFTLGSTNSKEATENISIIQGLGIALPALLYGIFVYWRWSKSKSVSF